MEYVNLTNHNRDLQAHPIANRINEIMHDGSDNSCINYLDQKMLLNRLGHIKANQFNNAIHYLVKHKYLEVQTNHGLTFYSLGSR
ncbi:hypothetical protein HGK75_02595 [uncultured bacterium]|nr:hypothetical protein HGK75_02595 [uncultured bacterium]